MCGIVAVIGSRDAAPLLMEGLKQLEYRGYDSAGIATIEQIPSAVIGRLICKRAKGKLANLTKLVTKEGSQGQLGIGHTRWATHGKPEERNAHPHRDASGQIAVVQNGIIENYRILRTELEKDGYEFISDTDTEVIPHLIAKELKLLEIKKNCTKASLLLEAIRIVCLKLKGTYALAVIWAETPQALVVTRKQAPLLIGLGEGEFICASDTTALAGLTKTILPMEDNEIALLTPLGIELYNSQGERQQRNPSLLQGADDVANKKDFRHFMLKEIHEQPETARLWLSRHLPDHLPFDSPVALPFSNSFYEGVERIQILACGTSRHAALVGAYLLEQFSGITTNVFHASEFRYAAPPLLPNTLTIGVTQSGETADTLAALAMDAERRFQHPDSAYAPRQLGITNRPESSISRQVQDILDIGAGIEIGVAATKTFLGQLLAFYSLSLTFAVRRNSRSKEEINNLVNELRTLPNVLKKLIISHDKLSESMANSFSQTQNVIFLGRGINYPIALEGALKLKEISYIHAEGYPAGEMKHGPIALLEKHVPVISIATKGVVFEKVISNAQEAKARDARLIGIAQKTLESDIFDQLLPLPEVSEWVSPLFSVIPMQLLSYHIAAHRGLDVDQPRNLAKIVTVE